MFEKHFFDAICSTGDGVFIVDADRQIVRWNEAAEKMLKYSEDEVLHRDCFRVISGKSASNKDFCTRKCQIHTSAIKGSHPKNFDLLTKTGNGEPIWLNVTILFPSNSSEPFIAHIVRDVTREKNAVLALQRFLGDLAPSDLIPGKGNNLGSAGENLSVPRHRAIEKSSVALSGREIEVLTLLAEGLSTKSLAQKLNISHFTARNHIQNILVKLGLHSKAQAVSYAFKKGIL
jgi:PAS domain S-box-containing protein